MIGKSGEITFHSHTSDIMIQGMAPIPREKEMTKA